MFRTAAIRGAWNCAAATEMSGSRPLDDEVTRSTGIWAAVSPLVYGPSSFRIAWICVAMSSDRGFDVGPRFVPLDVDAS